MTRIPLWLVSVVVAAAAPYAVNVVADGLVRRRRQRTEEALRRVHDAKRDNAPK